MKSLNKTVYIVTPSFNATSTIERTILSVVTQAGDFGIRFHVQDGGSTDGTLEIIERWKGYLDGGTFPLQCNGIHFSFESASDEGMYDALVKGFEKLSIPSFAFMTWINADDVLMTGSLSLVSKVAKGFSNDQVSWLTGVPAVMKDDTQIVQIDRPLPTQVIKEGLCDGTHWGFVQQEGTFFRGWLWNIIDPVKNVKKYKLAGDWNLWRLFSHYSEIVQVQWPLGIFRLSEGQLSRVNADAYMAEIESTVTFKFRTDTLRSIVDTGGIVRRILKAYYPSGDLFVVEKPADGQGHFYYHKNFGSWPARPLNDKSGQAERLIFEASAAPKKVETIACEPVSGGLPPKHENSIIPAAKSPNFFVVTPCLNVAATIDRTIQSVISQRGGFPIRYHVQDGGSTDGTIERLRYWSELLEKNVNYSNIRFTWSSAADMGMYDALLVGFGSLDIAPDDFMTWINGDDMLMPDAFSTVAQIFSFRPGVQWIGGTVRVIDENDRLVEERDMPVPTEVIREGLCDGRHWYHLQQEGMFFKKSLWFRAKNALNGFHLAGDWNLWREFARHTEYLQLGIPLGAFRSRTGQQSVARFAEYGAEIAATLPIEQRQAAFKRLYARRQSMQCAVVRLASITAAPVTERKEAAAYFEFFDKQAAVDKYSITGNAYRKD